MAQFVVDKFVCKDCGKAVHLNEPDWAIDEDIEQFTCPGGCPELPLLSGIDRIVAKGMPSLLFGMIFGMLGWWFLGGFYVVALGVTPETYSAVAHNVGAIGVGGLVASLCWKYGPVA